MKHKDLVEYKILCYIASYTINYGYAPTVREIARYIDKSVSNTHRYILRMLNDGKLTQKENEKRTLHVVGTTLKLFYNDGTEVIADKEI